MANAGQLAGPRVSQSGVRVSPQNALLWDDGWMDGWGPEIGNKMVFVVDVRLLHHH